MLLDLVKNGKYSTSDIERAYRDAIHQVKLNRQPLKQKWLENDYFKFLKLHEKHIEEYVENMKIKDQIIGKL